MHHVFTIHQNTIEFTKIYLEGGVQSCFVKKMFLEILQNSLKTPVPEFFLK